MSDCVFCKIVEGKIPARVVYRDEHCLAFDDISPCAPAHAILVPVRHIGSLDDLGDAEGDTAKGLLLAVRQVAREKGITGAYRLVSNCGEPAGQVVRHLHFHILGGRDLGWPPG